jgi:hypothetical protein
MSTEMPECWRCSLYKGEVALLRAEIAGLRNSVLSLTRRPADGAAVLEIVGMDEAERLAVAGPFAAAPDVWYRVSLTYREQLSVCCGILIDDPSALLKFFEDLAEHKMGWQGEKKVASREGQFVIKCTYEGKQFRPEVSMDVYFALEIPSFDPYWSVQLHLDVDPDSLESVAAQARAVFPSAPAEPSDAADRKPPGQP